MPTPSRPSPSQTRTARTRSGRTTSARTAAQTNTPEAPAAARTRGTTRPPATPEGGRTAQSSSGTSASCPPPVVEQTCTLAGLRALHEGLTRVDSTLIDLMQAEGRARPRSGRNRASPAPGWTKDTPMLARAAADLIEQVPGVFGTLSFSAADLRGQEEEVRLLGNIKFVAEKIAVEAGTALATGKTRLAENTGTVVDVVRAYLINPLTPRALKKELDRQAAPLFGLMEQRNATIQTTRSGRATLRSEADEARAEAERTALENRVLRGEDLPREVTVTPPAPPRKAGRRTGRTTRRPE